MPSQVTIVKFPKTPHLFDLGSGLTRDDKLAAEWLVNSVLSKPVLVEEKIDGANIGIAWADTSGLSAWCRNSVLGPGSAPQFAPLFPWLATRLDGFRRILGERYILFGEWCYARHSILYDRLPDFFLVFDLYDRNSALFLSRRVRLELLSELQLSNVPLIHQGSVSRGKLLSLLDTRSAFASGPVEGLYLRLEDEDRLVARAKLVRPEFHAAIDEHWSKRPILENRVVSATLD